MGDEQNVHLPMCTENACRPFLDRIKNVLQQQQIACVCEYPLGGLYKDGFQAAFANTSCTIIHVCPGLLKKVFLV
jgi:uncharacterized protein (DUF2237 family)